MLLLAWISEEKQQCVTEWEMPTFPRPSSNVGLHLGAIREGFGPDAIVIGDAISQVFDLHPQGSAALHIYCHYLTDTWSVRRGVCTGNTKTLDAAFLQATNSKAFYIWRDTQSHRDQTHAYLCMYNSKKSIIQQLSRYPDGDTRIFL